MTWRAWEMRHARYLRYFGRPEAEQPSGWKQLGVRCAKVAESLLADVSLGAQVAASWQAQAAAFGPTDDEAAQLFRETVASHERIALLWNSAAASGPWQPAWRIATELDRDVRLAWDGATLQTRRQALWHLRHYRHAGVDVSWLDEPRWQAAPSAFEFALQTADVTPQARWRWQHPDPGDSASRGSAEAVLSRLSQAIAELGYEAFVSDLHAREMRGGPDSPLGSDAVELLTAGGPESSARSRSIVVGVAQGLRPRHPRGLPTILDRILAVLERPAAAPALAISAVRLLGREPDRTGLSGPYRSV